MVTIMLPQIITETRDRRRRIRGLVAVLLAQGMLILDATVVNVALPAMRAEFRVDPAQLTWVTSAYLIAVGAMANLGLAEPYLPIRAAAHVVLGLGLGLSFLPLLMLAMSEVPPRDAGLGSAIVSLSIQLFGAVDLAILVTAASFRTHALEAAGAPAATATILGYRFAYAVAIGGILAGLTLATTLLRGRSRP